MTVNRRTHLNVDVCPVLVEQLFVVGHHIAVFSHQTYLVSPTIVPPPVGWIAIDVLCCLITERLGEVVLALPIFHADTAGVLHTTGSMNHAGLDQVVQLQVLLWIWNLGRDELVNVISCPEFVLSSQDDQDVTVWQACLLELDDMHMSHRHTKNVAVLDVTEEFCEVEVEDPRHQVRTMLFTLSISEVFHDVLDVWVAGVGHKQVRLPILCNNGHGVLVVMMMARSQELQQVCDSHCDCVGDPLDLHGG